MLEEITFLTNTETAEKDCSIQEKRVLSRKGDKDTGTLQGWVIQAINKYPK